MHNLLMQLFTLYSSKTEVSETDFFYLVTTQYDHPRYVKHFLGSICVFFTLFGYWVRGGGSPKGLVHNLLMQLFTLGTSKIEFLECYSSEPVIT